MFTEMQISDLRALGLDVTPIGRRGDIYLVDSADTGNGMLVFTSTLEYRVDDEGEVYPIEPITSIKRLTQDEVRAILTTLRRKREFVKPPINDGHAPICNFKGYLWLSHSYRGLSRGWHKQEIVYASRRRPVVVKGSVVRRRRVA